MTSSRLTTSRLTHLHQFLKEVVASTNDLRSKIGPTDQWPWTTSQTQKMKKNLHLGIIPDNSAMESTRVESTETELDASTILCTIQRADVEELSRTLIPRLVVTAVSLIQSQPSFVSELAQSLVHAQTTAFSQQERDQLRSYRSLMR